MNKIFLSLILFFGYLAIMTVSAQGDKGSDNASLLLDLKKTRADYEVSKQKMENDTKLYNEKAISSNEYERSRNELLSKEVDYQKLILKLISQQSYITVERAVKYQDDRGNRKVKITLKSAMEGNEEYLKQFEDHFDIFTPEMRSGKIYNIYVSLIDNVTKTIIGSPYEYHIPGIEMGKIATADFELLKDVEDLTVLLNYNNIKNEKNIYLKKDASANLLDITSMQFSQEADINSNTSYDLSLERFSTNDDIYRLVITGLPDNITYAFMDGTSKISQVKFTQGVNVKKLSLNIYLPDREDEKVVIGQPVKFNVIAISNEEFKKLEGKIPDDESLSSSNVIISGSEQLEIIPRGKGKIEVRANSLYFETNPEKEVITEVTIKNGGSRRLDNIKITAEKPLGWETLIEPGIIKALEPEKDVLVKVTITPPSGGGVGAQEVRIKTEAMAENQRVESEDKTIRIQVNAKTSIVSTLLLILVIIAFIGGIVWFGIRLSRK